MPVGAEIISAAVDGAEVAKPEQEGKLCRLPLGVPLPIGRSRQVSLRLSFPHVRLGFVGFAEFELPKTGTTIGTLSWVIVLPSWFRAQVMSSGLDAVARPPDLKAFGDYGRVSASDPKVAFQKSLVPARPVKVRLKYYQRIGRFNDDLIQFLELSGNLVGD